MCWDHGAPAAQRHEPDLGLGPGSVHGMNLATITPERLHTRRPLCRGPGLGAPIVYASSPRTPSSQLLELLSGLVDTLPSQLQGVEGEEPRSGSKADYHVVAAREKVPPARADRRPVLRAHGLAKRDCWVRHLVIPRKEHRRRLYHGISWGRGLEDCFNIKEESRLDTHVGKARRHPGKGDVPYGTSGRRPRAGPWKNIGGGASTTC